MKVFPQRAVQSTILANVGSVSLNSLSIFDTCLTPDVAVCFGRCSRRRQSRQRAGWVPRKLSWPMKMSGWVQHFAWDVFVSLHLGCVMFAESQAAAHFVNVTETCLCRCLWAVVLSYAWFDQCVFHDYSHGWTCVWIVQRGAAREWVNGRIGDFCRGVGGRSWI